jgi:hypothetical protein
MSLLKELENKKLITDVSKGAKERTNVTPIHSGRDPYSELKSTLHKKISADRVIPPAMSLSINLGRMPVASNLPLTVPSFSTPV